MQAARPEARPRQSVFVRIFLEAPQGASCGLSPCGAPDKLSANAIPTDGVYRGYPSTTPNRKQASDHQHHPTEIETLMLFSVV